MTSRQWSTTTECQPAADPPAEQAVAMPLFA